MNGEVSGQVLFNGRERTKEDMRQHAGYVQQSDHFMPFLTVYETLRYVALLRMNPRLSDRDKEDRVREIIAELGLRHVANTQIGGSAGIRGVSGGLLS
jgi:ATP-binding cassette subfamily G (WHITE) protein 8 (sterolin 2)